MLYTLKADLSGYVTPWCDTMTTNYYHHINILGIKGVENLGFEKMETPPYADAFILRHHAKKVDYLRAIRMSHYNAWLMTQKMLDVLLGFKLPNYSIYDAWVEHHKKKYPYKILHFYNPSIRFVDFKKSSFYITDYLDKTTQRVYINDEKEYYEERNKLPQSSPRYIIKAHKLYLVDEHDIDIDIFQIAYMGGGIFLKQNIADALKANHITGIDFEPITQPIVRHIRWADTGLPVED